MDLSNILQGVVADPRTAQEAQAANAQQAAIQPQAAAIPADGGSVGNVLAAILGPGTATPAPTAAPAADPAPAPAANPVNAMQSVIAAQPRTRHSLLDMLGRAADVIANVGGAPQQYQPMLDADTARAALAAKTAQDSTLTGQKITSNALDNGTQAGKVLQGAAAKLQAIVKANPQADVAKVWGLLTDGSGVDPTQSAATLAAIQRDPNILNSLAAGSDTEKEKYGGTPVYANGPDGKLHVLQVGLGANGGRDALPAGFTPLDPMHFVDAGGTQVGIGQHSGVVGSTVEKTVDPNKQLAADTSRANTGDNNATREHIASGHDATTVQVAGMPARAKAGEGGAGGDAYTAYRNSVQGAKTIHDTLGALAADPNIDKAVGNIQSRIPTQAKASILAKIAEIKGKVVPQAVASLKQSGLSRPAQAEVMATANGMISDLERLDQTPAEYREKIAHAQTFFQNMGRNLNETARRTGIVGGAKPAAPVAPKPAAAGGWSVVKVQ